PNRPTSVAIVAKTNSDSSNVSDHRDKEGLLLPELGARLRLDEISRDLAENASACQEATPLARSRQHFGVLGLNSAHFLGEIGLSFDECQAIVHNARAQCAVAEQAQHALGDAPGRRVDKIGTLLMCDHFLIAW